jgi:hypothetical protein
MEKYRAFLERFWRHFDSERSIHAVITANFGYYAEKELGAALEALDVPFIALHKENSWSPAGQAFWQRIYSDRRGPFLGRRILVYSPVERELQIRSGIADASRIEVVGMPRLDAVHDWRISHKGQIPKPVILFASFPPDVSMPVLKTASPNGRQERLTVIEKSAQHSSLAALCHSAHRAIIELAFSCPEVTVIVKTKGRARDRRTVNSALVGFRKGDLPPNLQIVHGGSPLPLIAQAAVVCGFHSTVLMEALAAGRPVVVPWYDEVLDPIVRGYVFDLGNAVIRASSAGEFADLLKELALRRTPVPQTLPPDALQILHEWLGNADGKAGERAAQAILRVMTMAN